MVGRAPASSPICSRARPRRCERMRGSNRRSRSFTSDGLAPPRFAGSPAAHPVATHQSPKLLDHCRAGLFVTVD